MSDNRTQALRALLFASSAAGMLCAGAAHAQDAAATTAREDRVQDVEVRGERPASEPVSPEFVAPLVDTPRSISVIPQQIIEQTGATSLQDLLRNAPGVTFGAGEGGQPLADRPFIRGQSSGNNLFVDGVRDAGGQQREVFNLEQVEIVRGPDSVYSGRGSGGGSINLSSKTPRATDFTHLSAGLGTDAYYRVAIDQNWAFDGTAGLRLNLMTSAGDVPGRNAVDFDKWGAAVSFGVGLDGPTRFVASYYHLTSDQMPDYGIPLFTKIGVRTTDSGVLDVPYESFYGVTDRDFLTNEVDTFTFQAQHRFSDALTIRAVGRYSETLNDYVVTNPGDGGNISNGGVQNIGGVYWMKRGLKSRWNPAETLALVIDGFGSFRTGALRHNYDIGLERSRERNRNAGYTITTTSGSACPAPMTGFDCTPLYDPNPSDPWTGTIVLGAITRNATSATGLYAFDSINIGERWVMNLGVRWDEYSTRGVTAANVAVPETSWDFVNWQAGLVYKPTASTSLYVSASTSSTPPTISAGDQNNSGGMGTGNLATELLDPEETVSYEIGAKANLFHGALSLSAALFQLTRENAQILVSAGVYEQAGEVEVKGLELGFSGNITPAWQVFGGYTWMDSELVRGAYNGVNTGDPLANTPEHSFSLFTTYRVLPRLTLGGGAYYVSDSFGGNQGGAGGGTNRIYAPAWTRVDLYGAYDLTERASLQLNVQNVGDERYIVRTNGVHHADVAPGRQAILSLNLRF